MVVKRSFCRRVAEVFLQVSGVSRVGGDVAREFKNNITGSQLCMGGYVEVGIG